MQSHCDRRSLMGGTVAGFLALGLPGPALGRTLGQFGGMR